MKRFLLIVIGLLVLVVGALLIGPSMMDWNKYKPQIVEQAKSAAGYDVRIDGDLGLSVLPYPQLKIEKLIVKAPRGSAENLITMEQANVSVKLMPLLSGNVVIDTVRLVNPVIAAEILRDGSSSWESDKMIADKNAAASDTASSPQSVHNAASPSNITLEKLIIENGTVSYSDAQTGKNQKAEQINAALRVDSLQGPFDISGDAVYNGQKVGIEASTDKALNSGKEIPAAISLSLPDSKAEASFKGVVAMEPLEIQGKMEINASDLAAVLAMNGEKADPKLAQKLSFSGLVTANEQQLRSEDLDVSFGDTKGKGSIAITNLQKLDPARLDADLTFEGVLDLDRLMPQADKSKEPNVEEKVARGEKLSPNKGLLPESVSLPFPFDGNIRLAADGVQYSGKQFKGIVASFTKTGPAIDLTAKAMDMPGKTQVDTKANLRFATASRSGEKGVLYADPTVTFSAAGSSEQLPTLLRAFVEDADKNAALEIYKTAKFNLQGNVNKDSVILQNSRLQLDDTTAAIDLSYKPRGEGGRADVGLDLTTDFVDIDYIQSRLNGQARQAVQTDDKAKTDVKKALEPVRSFEMPVNLVFDVSVQKAVFNQQNINGVRIKGKAAGQSLSLDVASVQDFLGAAASLKGAVGNLKDLSGIDLSFYGKTSNLKNLMQSLKIDASKLPQSISGAEATVAAKGTADSLAFDAKVSALDGALNAAGTATGLLGTPTFNNLTIGAEHPNLVRAVQIMNPSFTGGEGLQKPFSFNAKAVKNGETYDLSGVKATLGATSIAGDLKINTAGAVPSVTGAVNAGNIPLDSLLGADTGGSAGGGSDSGAAASSGGGKWSRDPIETGWMHSVNLDLALSAQSITYGGWNLVKPNTKIVLKDGNLTVDNLQSGLFGGTANLSAKVQDPADAKQPLSIAVQSTMEKVDLAPLVTALSGSDRMQTSGDVSLDFNVQTTGLSAHALVSALQGKANLGGNSVVFKGFDLAQIGLAFVDTGKPLDRLNNLVGGATQSGETRFDTIKGNYDIMQGVATITSMSMDGPAANIVSKGNVNLPLWTIDTIHTITFKQAKDAGAFDVAIKGPLSNPGNTFGRGLFNDVLTRRLQQKAVEKLPDVLGKDLSGKLQNLGILPQKQAPAPVTDAATPTNGSAAPGDSTAPVQAQPEAAPVEQPQGQSQEDPAKKALQGVLKGLLQ